MVTWEQARQIVYDALRPARPGEPEQDRPGQRSRWDPADGALQVPSWGYADERSWHVPYGARVHLLAVETGGLGEDVFVMLVGDPEALVDRETGELTFVPFLMHPARFSAMVQVGQGHPVE